jgi:hypothetical protein
MRLDLCILLVPSELEVCRSHFFWRNSKFLESIRMTRKGVICDLRTSERGVAGGRERTSEREEEERVKGKRKEEEGNKGNGKREEGRQGGRKEGKKEGKEGEEGHTLGG